MNVWDTYMKNEVPLSQRERERELLTKIPINGTMITTTKQLETI